ncbi:Vacuolar protein sorting-associated protein 37C [Chytridiales sp. JEL 0842]|nr:Vacuolar protein sorting-associated protein 37C [Chytridiales sp. JEL 0842]
MGLENKTLEELEELLTDDRAFEQLLFQLPSIQSLTKTKSEYISFNASQAQSNLAHQTTLTNLRTSMREHQDTFKRLKNEYEDALRQHQEASVKFEPAYLLSRLRSGVGEAEEVSESISTEFLEGKVGVEDFIKNFRETRKVYHLRAIKLEKAERDPKVFGGP